MRYNVIFIDDEWETSSEFIKTCSELHDIDIVPFRTRRSGIEELKRNFDKWDAVLIDAQIYDETENEEPRLTGLQNAVKCIEQLKTRRNIPYFVVTGQKELATDKTFRQIYGKFYMKGGDDARLIEDMKRAIEEEPERQVEYLYQSAFDALESLSPDDSECRYILRKILLVMHFPDEDADFDPKVHFNRLRQLAEYVFLACRRVAIIPEECFPDDVVNLNQCSLFVAGKNAKYAGVRYGNPNERIVPRHIENILFSVIEFGNKGSHVVKNKNFGNISAQYMLFGLTLQMCYVIRWFRDYIDLHRDVNANRRKIFYLR